MRALVLVGLVGCGGHAAGTGTLVDAGADVDGFDVLITSTASYVYAGFTTGLDKNGPRFAKPGGCATSSDAYSVVPTCLRSITLGGVALSGATLGDAVNPFWTTAPVTADETLEVSACGTTISAPVHARTGPAATGITAMRVGSDVTVSWSVGGADTSLVTLGTDFGGDSCLDAGQAHTFPNWSAPSRLTGSVQPLLGPEITETALGQVRVWYGDATPFTVP